MERTTLPIQNIEEFKQKALVWAAQFSVCTLLDNNQYSGNIPPAFEWKLAVDFTSFVEEKTGAAFNKLEEFAEGKKYTIFGFFSYDLKNEVENLESKNPDLIGFPQLFFFEPRYVLEIKDNRVSINRNYAESYEIIDAVQKMILPQNTDSKLEFSFRVSKEEYIKTVAQIRQKIEAGNFYELNYCVEAFAENVSLEPLALFHKLNQKTLAPFSCFVKYFHKYLLCASPERFLKKEGNKIISQPIKGTAAKSQDKAKNEQLKSALQQSEKERAENVMIVDLVRNDIAKSCKAGSVQVDELCGVYEFETVNQMISTVSGTLRDDASIAAIIKAAFPMGSMTGAPKIEAMKTIDTIENFQRNIYSGSVGYITPEKDFDLNVVIRSIFYDRDKAYISLRSGGAITYASSAEKEWEEMLLKMKAMRELFEQENHSTT